jgi:hypothetical protein
LIIGREASVKEFVSQRRIQAAEALTAMLILAASLLGGLSMGSMSHGALAILMMTTTVVCLGRLGPGSAMARVMVKPFRARGMLSVVVLALALVSTGRDTRAAGRDEAVSGPRPSSLTLTGPRYQTMQALARYLDQTAQGALEGATDDARHGTIGEARFVYAIRSFAVSTTEFRRRIDGYAANPFDVAAEVALLTASAREVSDHVRAARVLQGTYDEWDGIRDVLPRMTHLLAGEPVEVPAAYVVPALSGAGLEEFVRLAHDLDASTHRAQGTARRDVGKYERGEQFLGELGYFADQSHDLHLRADAATVGPEIGPIVDRLLEEARQADRRMRDAHTFTEVWDDSGRTITILERMATLVRS